MVENAQENKNAGDPSADVLQGAHRYKEKRRVPVIIADDSSTSRKQIVKSLRNADTRVVTFEASDGRESLDKLTELRENYGADPALIILDLNMPKMDGWQVMKWLKWEYKKFGKKTGIPLAVFSSTNGKKRTHFFKKDIHNIRYEPLVAVAKEECTETGLFDTKGAGGLESWIRYFLDAPVQQW